MDSFGVRAPAAIQYKDRGKPYQPCSDSAFGKVSGAFYFVRGCAMFPLWETGNALSSLRLSLDQVPN